VSRLRWSRRAVDDLLEIGEDIAADDPAAARAWVETLRARARQAARSPGTGRKVPELDREDAREVLLRNDRIVYRVMPRGIVVVTVFEGHRRLPGVDPEAE